MKKLSLKASDFQKGEVLTRSQLKKVLGGGGSGDGDGSGSGGGCPSECSTNADCITDRHPKATCDTYSCDEDHGKTNFKVCISHD